MREDGRQLLDGLGLVHIKVEDVPQCITEGVAGVRLQVLHQIDQLYVRVSTTDPNESATYLGGNTGS
jgi:hypothetical protein